MRNRIQIREVTLEWNPEVKRWQVELEKVGDLRMVEIPSGSHLDVLGIELPKDFDCEVCIVNSGYPGDDDGLSMYGGVSIRVTKETAQIAMDRLTRAFDGSDLPDNYERSSSRISLEKHPISGFVAHAYFSLQFKGYGDTTVRDALETYLSPFQRLLKPYARVFICHASEDKETVRLLSDFITANGHEVWLDEREIRVGHSIVDAIANGIENATHFAVVLSKSSVNKSWVKRELSSALMRNLADQSISILPVRLDDSPIPVLLTDIKYADCRTDLEEGFTELVRSALTRAR